MRRPTIEPITADEAEELLTSDNNLVIFRKSSNPDYFTISYYNEGPVHVRFEMDEYNAMDNVKEFLEIQGIEMKDRKIYGNSSNSMNEATNVYNWASRQPNRITPSSSWASKAFANAPKRAPLPKSGLNFSAWGNDGKLIEKGLPFVPKGFVGMPVLPKKGGKRTRRNRRNRRTKRKSSSCRR
jgi:hypothetical protein